jgi:hypothetical protein
LNALTWRAVVPATSDERFQPSDSTIAAFERLERGEQLVGRPGVEMGTLGQRDPDVVEVDDASARSNR